MKKFSFNSITRKQPPKGVFIQAICKSWHHRHLSISIVIGIGIGISVAKKIFFDFIIFLKIEHLCSFLCLVTTLIPLYYTLPLISLRFSIRSSKGIHWCSKKRQVQLSEASVHWCFEKFTSPKISAYFSYFPAKHPGWSFF